MLSEKQTEVLVNNVNRDVNLPFMNEDYESKVIERVFEKVNPLMEPALRALVSDPYVDCLKIALQEGISVEEKQEMIKKILRRALAAPLAEKLNEMCDVPFVPEEEEPSEEDEPEKPRELVTLLNAMPHAPGAEAQAQVSDWRFRTTSQTVNGVLFICLNIGVDPPDVDRPAACARMECWFEPDNTATQKSLSVIKGRLHDQYKKWHPNGRFKVCGDPTIVDLHKQCKSARKNAKRERVLFHYNGHGVPMPTETGEIWLFNSNYTKYIPLNLTTDLQSLVGNPSLYIFDCNAAGRIINYFRQASGDVPFLGDEGHSYFHPHAHTRENSEIERDCVVLASCGAEEKLPVDQKLPADLFTSCLTTPIRTALYCYAQRSLITGVTPEMIDRMPGTMDDRNTPLGDLARIFTTVSDTIAWNVLPRRLFKRLFRQDLLLASMMRNFLLACRIMRYYGCTPESIPQLPESHNHPLWESFEYTMEQYLAQLPSNFRIQKAVQAEREYREQFSSKLSNEDADINGLHKATLMREESRNSGYMSSFALYRHPMQTGYSVTSGPLLTHNLSYQPSTFFEDQIKGFEVWLDMGDETQTPQQLPILLLLLIQSNYRQKGLQLLSRFLQIGRKAVEQALSIGVFPYILQYLKAGDSVLLPQLVLIWGKILAFDPKCKVDLVKISAHHHFVDFLSPAHDNQPAAARTAVHLAVALFIVAIFGTQPEFAYDCQRVGIRDICLVRVRHPDPLVRRWACLCLFQILQNGKFDSAPELLQIANDIADTALVDDVSEVRAAGVCAIAEVLYRAMHIVRNDSAAPKPVDVDPSLTGTYGRLLQGEYSSASPNASAGVSSSGDNSNAHRGAAHNYAMRIQSSQFDLLNTPPLGDGMGRSRSANHSRHPATHPDRTPDSFDAPPARLLEHQIVERVGRIIARMGLINTSVLVRREVATALSHAAHINPDPFVSAANEFPGLSDRILEKIRSKVPFTCYTEMWLTLIELALDPHPIVASCARSSFDMILSHAFAGNNATSEGSVSTQSDALESPFSSYPSYPVGANPTSTGSMLDDIRENRRSITRDIDAGPENTHKQHTVLQSTSPDDGNRVHFNEVPTLPTERPRRSLPSLFNRDTGVHSSVIDDRRAVVHVRGSSGRFNLNSVAPQGRIPRVNSASVINLNDTNYPPIAGAFDDERSRLEGDIIADSPKFHLGAGVMNLFNFFIPQSGSRHSHRSSSGSNGLYGPERSSDRVSSPPRMQIRSRSYQVLPPENSVVGKLSVSYEQDNNDVLSNIRDKAGSSNDDRNRNYRRLLRPPVEKAVDSLFSWSCACMSRISIESNSADHLPEPDPKPQYTKLWDSILRQDSEHYLGSGRGPFTFNVENAALETREGPTTETPGATEVPLLQERTTHLMGAGGGAVVSLAFLPREIGREGDEYIVTGDSTGSVGVYDTRSGECQSSFGIPAPPGIPDVEVRSVMCLNSSRESSWLRAFMQHAPLIVAGSYDGRVAVFRPDLVTKKYSVLSSFQASGRSLWSNFRRNDGDKMRRADSGGASSSWARRDATHEMKTLLHSSGNGLVMDFQAFSRCLHVAGCEDNILRVWDLTREMCTWEGEVADKSVWPTAVSSPPWASHSTVVVGASDGSVTVTDTRARAERRVLGSHGSDPVVETAYALWPGARESIVSADCEGTVRVWDARQSGSCRSKERAHDANLSAMTVHRAGNYVATGSTAGTVKVFPKNLASPEQVTHRRAKQPGEMVRMAPVTGLALQHEPASLAVGCSDATVTVFDIANQ